MERRVNVRGIIFNQSNHIFAVKHRTHDGGESDYWAIPGGGLDPGESFMDGLQREFVEELGITPVIGKLLLMQQFLMRHHDGRISEKMELFFHVTNTDDYAGVVDLSATSHGHELTRTAFINPKTEDLLPSFLKDIDMRDLITNDRPVRIVNNLNEIGR